MARANTEIMTIPPDTEPLGRRLVWALKFIQQYADTTWDYWNNDQDSKVGKRLGAMSGGTGYSPELDAVWRILAEAEAKA